MKAIHSLGLILGIIMMIAGLVTTNSPLDSYSTANVSFAAFGGDYYTEQYAATKAAVQNTAATANYLEEIGEKLVSCIGLGFLFSGALVSLHHAEFLLSSLKETTNAAESEKNINEKPIDKSTDSTDEESVII